MSVYEKLLNVQCELNVPKDKFNKFGSYYFRNCESILEAVKPLCKKHKALILLNDSVEIVGAKNYVVSTATFIDLESGERVETSSSAREDEALKGMNSAQITGSCSSYARKYALCGLLNLDDGKDNDNADDEDDENTTYPACAVCGKIIEDLAAAKYVKETGKMIKCSECAKR